MNKNYIPDLQALKQAMQPFEQEYKVIRTKINRYNDLGRNDNIEVCDTVKGSIQVDTNTYDLKSDGRGLEENTTYTITLISPEYVEKGDIIITEEYGRLKVTDKSYGNKLFGTESFTLVRTGTINPIVNAEDYL